MVDTKYSNDEIDLEMDIFFNAIEKESYNCDNFNLSFLSEIYIQQVKLRCVDEFMC